MQLKLCCARHKNLCVAFEYKDLDRPVQIIPKDFSVPWNTLDLSALEPPERERSWAELVQRDRLARLNPNVSPLFRFLLVRCAPEESRLLITTHHILVDGWSVPLMIPRVAASSMSIMAVLLPYRESRRTEIIWRGLPAGTAAQPKQPGGSAGWTGRKHTDQPAGLPGRSKNT